MAPSLVSAAVPAVPSQRLRPGEQARQTDGGLPFHRLRLRWRRPVVRLFLEAEVVSSLDR